MTTTETTDTLGQATEAIIGYIQSDRAGAAIEILHGLGTALDDVTARDLASAARELLRDARPDTANGYRAIAVVRALELWIRQTQA